MKIPHLDSLTHACRLLALASGTALLCQGAVAQTGNVPQDIRLAVERALLPVTGQDATELVRRIGTVAPEEALSRNFVLADVVNNLFVRGNATPAADCRVQTTAAGEPDTGRCTYAQGRLDDPGGGAYTALSFSRNLGQGDVRYVRRAAFVPGGTSNPQPVRLSDAQAYQLALQYARLLGVPGSEIPMPPNSARVQLPVRTLAVGAGDDQGNTLRVPLQKVVNLQRAFRVPGGLFVDGNTGVRVDHVLAPGSATLVLDDSGLQFARIDGWSDAQIDPQASTARVKSVASLVDEISADLFNEGIRQPGVVSVRVAMRRAYPHPEDPNPPPCTVCGVLRPALLVTVAQVGSEPVATSARDFVAPGVVREYDLLEQDASERPAR